MRGLGRYGGSAQCRALGRAAAVVPHSGGRGRVTRHGVAGVGAMLQGNLAVFVQLLELGPPVLEPDLHLSKDKENTSTSAHTDI